MIEQTRRARGRAAVSGCVGVFWLALAVDQQRWFVALFGLFWLAQAALAATVSTTVSDRGVTLRRLGRTTTYRWADVVQVDSLHLRVAVTISGQRRAVATQIASGDHSLVDEMVQRQAAAAAG